MAPQQPQNDQIQAFLAEFNTRLRDIDERNRLIRERVLLLGKNFISSRQEIEEKIEELLKENREIKKDIETIKRTSGNIITSIDKFIKKDEMRFIERMLKDFQPLEFMRKKDVETLINEKLAQIKKQIKNVKTT